ncbi:MAG: diacylglycerol kinase family lipid kinase [Thermoproteota archaeon]|nr:diacylglycerol kinase family lipid kinase [Thermoproteota archaeon]
MAVEQEITNTSATTTTTPPIPFAPRVSDRSSSTTTPSARSKRTYHRRKSIKQNKIDTVLVVNPNSSGGLTGKGWNDLYSEIKDALGTANVEVALTKKAGDGAILTRQFLKQGFKKVVAIGGDGTLNEVANGFFEEPVGIHSNTTTANGEPASKFPPLRPINPDAIMGVVPAGTRNVLAKSLGLPEGIANCCKTFQLGKAKKMDVIYVTVTSQEDHSSTVSRIFLNAAEMGVAGEIIERSKKVREVVNSRIVSTITSIAATLPTYQSNECEVSIDNDKKKFAIKMTMAVVANGQFLGGGFKVAPHAKMSDGLLDLVILKDSGSLKMVDELINMKDGNYEEEDNITYRQVRKVSLISKERDVTVTVDGEPIGILPATFEVIPHALTVRM